jgi:hypothetical protein
MKKKKHEDGIHIIKCEKCGKDAFGYVSHCFGFKKEWLCEKHFWPYYSDLINMMVFVTIPFVVLGVIYYKLKSVVKI